jgi:hypothetical protein
MDPKRGAFESVASPNAAATHNPMAMPDMNAAAAKTSPRPVVGAGVAEIFVPAAGGADDVIYQPHLLREGLVHFSSAKAGVDGSRTVRLVNPITPSGIDWEKTVPPPLKLAEGGGGPAPGAGFAELPGFAMNAANYKQVEKDFGEWLYRNERADVFSCPSLKAWSQLGESESDFRARLLHQAHEARDAAIDKIRTATAKKITALETRLRTAEGQLAKEKAEANASKMQAGVSVLGGILGGLFGRKAGLGSITRGSASIGKATSAYKQHQDVANADAKVEGVVAEIEAIKTGLEAEIARISESFDPAALALETESLKPTRTNVKVQTVALLWLPCDARGERAW